MIFLACIGGLFDRFLNEQSNSIAAHAVCRPVGTLGLFVDPSVFANAELACHLGHQPIFNIQRILIVTAVVMVISQHQ